MKKQFSVILKIFKPLNKSKRLLGDLSLNANVYFAAKMKFLKTYQKWVLWMQKQLDTKSFRPQLKKDKIFIQHINQEYGIIGPLFVRLGKMIV